MSDNELRKLFREFGVVTHVSIIRHKHSGKSAGYGFVEMSTGEQAINAAGALEGTVFAGRSLRLYVTPYTTQTSSPRIQQEHS